VLLPAAIISSVLLLFVTITKREPSRWLALTAAITLAAVFAISLAVNVPINTEQHSWNVLAPPSDWVSVRDRWQTAHLARAILALFSFVVLTAIPVARHTPGKPLVG
jgi:Anthrone oxygenase